MEDPNTHSKMKASISILGTLKGVNKDLILVQLALLDGLILLAISIDHLTSTNTSHPWTCTGVSYLWEGLMACDEPILTTSWKTTRPAPMLRWPTSELPMRPSGKPTAVDEASSLV